MLALLLLAGLLPVTAWGLLTGVAAHELLSLSLGSLEQLLERADVEMEHSGTPALRAEIARARLNLAQAEVARRSMAQRLPYAFALLMGASVVLAALTAGLISRRLSKPIEQLTEGATRFAQGELTHQIPERAGGKLDELQILIHQFNRMGSELRIQRERLQLSEKLAAWQQVARALAHELRNPLTAMKLSLGRLARWSQSGAIERRESEALRESIQLLDEEIDVLMRMTEAFSSFARLPPPSPRPVELRALLQEVCALYRHQSSVPIECTADGPVEVEADPDQLRRAFGNLVKNSIEASKAGDGSVLVAVLANDASAQVTVNDRGHGIPAPLHAPSIPTLSTKSGGSGLGLTICQKILHDHGGSVRLEPRPGGGTQAIVELPRRFAQPRQEIA
ncbi:MAG TPA: ATP-binding protein [Myxococcaceae bacterium]|nr:ATP-binding protein [Myxococcaceae bacterium]